MSEIFGKVNLNGEDYELSRDNVTVYRHLGNAALFDHVFIQTSENDGFYYWSHYPNFEKLVEGALNAEAQVWANIPEASELDRETYIRHDTVDLVNSPSYPEEWDNGTSESE